MANSDKQPSCQVIDADGAFDEAAVSAFVQASGVADARADYQVVAIMGPQSSGKSTLMNTVFGTSFQEMDAMRGRSQTTQGVWLARAPKIDAPATLVLDLEGSDGRERGEDDTNFERQSALFALAVADVLLVNVWCHDIGREHGSGKPLMKTIFQVNLKLFAPEPSRRRTVLLFVVRDKSKTPLAKLVEVLQEDLDKMWDAIAKPPQHAGSRLADFFELQFTALPHYEDRHEDFCADAVVLRRRFTPDGDDTLVRAAPDRLPADAFALSAASIWGVIRSQKDLNLPAHKVMVAGIRCGEIKADQLRAFASDQAWQALEQEAEQRLVAGFGARAAALVDSCLQGYEVEAGYFDRAVREEHRADLVAKLGAAAAAPFAAQARLLAGEQLAEFERDLRLAAAERPREFSAGAAAAGAAALRGFDERAADLLVAGTELSPADARERLAAQVAERVDAAKRARVKEALHATEATLNKLVAAPALELLTAFPAALWQQLAEVRAAALESAGEALGDALAGVALTDEEQLALAAKLEAAADRRLGDLLQEAALTRVSKMRDAFTAAFSVDEHGTPRTWRAADNIPALARAARREAARVLALLCVRRGADYAGGDAVEAAIMAMVRKDIDEGGGAAGGGASTSAAGAAAAAAGGLATPVRATPMRGGGGASVAATPLAGGGGGFELATATQWPGGVPPGDVLVAPHEARLAWREFMAQSALAVQQAQVTQQANLLAGKRAPPVWALAAILFLGWNELMAVLWNPIYLLVGAALFALGWQVYQELDVDAEMQRGPLVGALNVWGKLGGVLRTVVAQNVELAQHLGGALVDSARAAAGDGEARAMRAAGGLDGSPGPATGRRGQQQQPHATGLKQRGAGAAAGGGSVQMTALDGAFAAAADGGGDSRKDE